MGKPITKRSRPPHKTVAGRRTAVAFIGGTGFEEHPLPVSTKKISVKTPFGTVSVEKGAYRGANVYFLLRHGKHHIAPHEVNYRANAQALYQLGVQAVLTSAAVGSLNPRLRPGSLLLLDDFIDMTRNRPATVLTVPAKTKEHRAASLHADMTEPYSHALGAHILKAAAKHKIPIARDGVYICAEGPRFETRAEIKAYARMGADVVGMTNVPEVVFARELGIPYAAVAVVTNMASGLGPPLPASEVITMMRRKAPLLRRLFQGIVDALIG